jgi:hypothetical protein
MTAVEWLVEQLEKNKFITKSQIFIAKEMENRQSKNYAEFAIHCDREKVKILNFNDFMKL